MPPLDGKPAMWRSLDDLAGDPAYREAVQREFPAYADEMLAPSRRDFLRLMGASVALAGATACRRWPTEHIVPMAHRPEGYVPGEMLRYATSFDLGGSATGLLVTSYDGRPIKIEGNPLHPSSLGATDPLAQATVLQLYDPDRSTEVVERSAGATSIRRPDDFGAWADTTFTTFAAAGGQGLRVLAEPTSSPTMAALKARFARRFPRAVWVEWDPLSADAAREGARMAFGRPVRTVLDLGRATCIVSFDADLFFDDPQAIENQRAWAKRRRAEDGTMNRMWSIEAGFTNTGASADHRIAVQSGLVPVVLGRLAARLRRRGLALSGTGFSLDGALERFAMHPYDDPRIDAIAADLVEAGPSGLVVVGKRQPPAAHALAHALNAALGSSGSAVRTIEDPDPERPSHREGIARLAGDIGAGLVDAVVVIGGNPAFDAPADLDLGTKLASVANTARLGLYDDETSRVCRWHVPQAHYLEAWGDARAWDGTASIAQPLIEPLYAGWSAIEMVARLADGKATPGYELVRSTWTGLLPGDFEPAWRRVVHDGIAAGTAVPEAKPALAGGWERALAQLGDARALAGTASELVFTRSFGFYDGRFANLGWLAELPDPVTKLTWDNAALMSPADAAGIGVKGNGDLVAIESAGASLTMPAYILPGQPQGCVSVALGWGRTSGGRIAAGLGADTYRLRRSDALWRHEARIVRAPGHVELATTQDHHVVDALGKKEQAIRADTLIRTGTLAEYKEHPAFAKEMIEIPPPAPLWKPHEYPGHKWGMAIDLTACTGCGACTIACQAENNIPIVGKSEVLRGREMHWIRVDRYFAGSPERPRMAFQPMACVHCENAPCEQVCPVAATVHDHEGLNVMIYNRCVGTRYCSNNCPYKVRRFNWFNNHRHETAVETMVYNPEVTVRSRGVMEKCTYCIQRIETGKIAAKNDRRDLRDGEIVPACAQVCPTEAIVFGDLNLAGSRVAAAHADPRAYGVLDEVNTGPRTRYLARLRNPVEGEA